MDPDRPARQVHRIVATARADDEIGLGPDHPTLDGLPRLGLAVEHGVVTAAEWIPGSMHRGVEKLFESRDYRQVVVLADRHDWHSAFCSEVGVVVGAERALGLVPPQRAQQVRVLLCELTRISHHLAFLAPMPGPLPGDWRRASFAWREEVLGLVEQATGHRIHPMFCQVGGVRADVEADWVARVADAATRWAARGMADLDDRALREALDGYAGVAVLARSDALGFGASGPVARASGVDLDLRRDDPCLPYPAFEVPTARDGDARARMRLLVEEVRVSVGLVAWAAAALRQSSGGPVAVRLPKVLRVPETTRYTWTENPTGINGYLLVSRNERTPWRLKVRSAGFGNAAALGTALVGTSRAEVARAVASFLLVTGDVDR